MKTARYFILVVTMICALALIVSCSFPIVSRAEGFAVGSTAFVIADKLNMRKEPQGEIIGKIPRNATVTILSERDRNGYYRVRVDSTGSECYAYGEYLVLLTGPSIADTEYNDNSSSSAPADDGSDTAYWENATLVVISQKQLNLRKKPSRQGFRIKYLEWGDRVEVVSTQVKNNYILVRDLTEGKVGYVNLAYVAYEGDVDFIEGCYQDPCCKCTCCYCNQK